MARTGRGGAATKSRSAKSRNDTPNTPDVDESKIARLKVDELRQQLKDRGVRGISELRKPELVKRLVAAYREDESGGGQAKKSATGRKTTDSGKATGGGKATAGAKKSAGSGVRKGAATSKSVKYSQEITSPAEEPERPGRSLVTTDHDVIRQWAEERNAVPATIEGTEHGDHLGVLRFDFPGYDSGSPLREVSWEEWFTTFDERRLNFIYQQERSDGQQSNFFRLESPDREDG